MKINYEKQNENLKKEISILRLACVNLVFNQIDLGGYSPIDRISQYWIENPQNLPFEERAACTKSLVHYFKAVDTDAARIAQAIIEDPDLTYNKNAYIQSILNIVSRTDSRRKLLNRSFELIKTEFEIDDFPEKSSNELPPKKRIPKVK